MLLSLSPTLLTAAGVARTHTSPQGTGGSRSFQEETRGGGGGDWWTPLAPNGQTYKRTGSCRSEKLCVRACVCRVSFFFASAASNIILFVFFFKFFFLSSFDIV
uniref:Secreted protein n=1 Tax=Rhipicephalus appendiculatus TaxID=34631 RepID=A0A131YAT4_RHIAP